MPRPPRSRPSRPGEARGQGRPKGERSGPLRPRPGRLPRADQCSRSGHPTGRVADARARSAASASGEQAARRRWRRRGWRASSRRPCASGRSSPPASAPSRPAAKASPAPVTSTGSVGTADAVTTVSPAQARAPAGPRVTTTSAWSAASTRAARSGSVSPVSSSASSRFGQQELHARDEPAEAIGTVRRQQSRRARVDRPGDAGGGGAVEQGPPLVVAARADRGVAHERMPGEVQPPHPGEQRGTDGLGTCLGVRAAAGEHGAHRPVGDHHDRAGRQVAARQHRLHPRVGRAPCGGGRRRRGARSRRR